MCARLVGTIRCLQWLQYRFARGELSQSSSSCWADKALAGSAVSSFESGTLNGPKS